MSAATTSGGESADATVTIANIKIEVTLADATLVVMM